VNNEVLFDISKDPGENVNVIEKYEEVAKTMRAAYDKWWAETRPLMVNEDVPYAAERPFFVLYEKQLQTEGIPQWEPPEF
jgi:arylsulfatase